MTITTGGFSSSEPSYPGSSSIWTYPNAYWTYWNDYPVTGWKCPRCHCCYAPWISKCSECKTEQNGGAPSAGNNESSDDLVVRRCKTCGTFYRQGSGHLCVQLDEDQD